MDATHIIAKMNPEVFFHTKEKAAPGTAEWLTVENGETESIPLAGDLNYELGYDEHGCVLPTLAIRSVEGSPEVGVQLTTNDLLQLGEWCVKTAMFKLQITCPGVKGAQARTVLVEQVNGLLTTLKGMAPDVLSGRFDRAERAAALAELRDVMDAKLHREREIHREHVEQKYAQAILDIARVAARTNQDYREEGLSDPRIEKMIVRAKEVLDADSPSSIIAPATRQG
tara:strand:+ start:3460 stop:4140 length:681 start_codon:yes stop_codon:yes gene_type:complete